ncbi:hypothetical protein [Candidatus Lokiarchaeum ossiferum]|uniref:hypothetical protein n=1 Tax=Candidatus Lokiarchaeum ossiferum TaxID=2951803 RepID=UPI00352E4306
MLTALRLIYQDYLTVYAVTSDAEYTPQQFIETLRTMVNDRLDDYGISNHITINEITQS